MLEVGLELLTSRYHERRTCCTRFYMRFNFADFR